jgi:preprotein translocase subunit SecA
LCVIGTERHESRRIDNQLRGRSGRQGDPGKSIFFISLEDDLMRIFGSESIDSIMQKFGLKEGESIDHPWINKALERAQKRVEGRNFDIRKTLLKFDDVMNDQRKVIFEQRKKILESKDISKIADSFLEDLIKNFSNEKIIYTRENQVDAFKAKIKPVLGRAVKEEEFNNIIQLKDSEFENSIKNKFYEFRNKRNKAITETANLELEKRVFIQTIDFLWRSHLQYLEHLRQVVGLRGYAQKDPLEEFRREAFKLFEDLLHKIKVDFITFLNNLEVVDKENSLQNEDTRPKKNISEMPRKMKRNEPCYCGSEKKYKHCCGAL